jgi:cell division protein FtsW (lipid II flippase)
MGIVDATLSRPRATGIVCVVGAVMLGLAYLAVAGAPMLYLVINLGALVIGLATLAMLGSTTLMSGQRVGGVIAALACALVATTLLGDAVDGATRWIRFGGLSIQPSLIALPLMTVAFARYRGTYAMLGIVVAAAAMAMQPDRSMAGMLTASLGVLAILRPERHVIAAFAVSIASFATTLTRADTVPAMPYVEQVLYTSFDVHALAGAAVLGGAVLLVLPAVVGWFRDPENRTTYAVFGAAWLAAIAAAALGNYPTPIVGYGGSAIIGYALSLLALPKRARARAEAKSQRGRDADAASTDRRLRIGLA